MEQITIIYYYLLLFVQSLQSLQVDFVARINNNHEVPQLAAFESVDTSGNWKHISSRFAGIEPEPADFPNKLMPLHVMPVAALKDQFVFDNKLSNLTGNMKTTKSTPTFLDLI